MIGYACFVIGALIGIILTIYRKLTTTYCTCKNDMDGKVVIVTGGSSGIGYRVALDLARRGARVLIAARDAIKGSKAKEKIIEATGNINIIFRQVDFESLESVRHFAYDVLSDESRVDVLVNNAGSLRPQDALTEDGLLADTQVNYFAHFLLTVILLPLLKSSAPCRIINLSAWIHHFADLDLATFTLPAKDYIDQQRRRANIKLAVVLFTKKLSRLSEGSGITVNCVNPGATSTGLYRHSNWMIRLMALLMFKRAEEGAQSVIHCAVAPELRHISGKYFVDCREAQPSRMAFDCRLASQLWELSEITVNWALLN